MVKPKFRGERNKQLERDALFERASKQLDEGKLVSAFRLFLIGAKAGDTGAQLSLGNLYSEGVGVGKNRSRALYWYGRAYRQGYGPAASNIGVMLRNEKKLSQALAWFERAVKLEEHDANLEIARIYLQKKDPTKARPYLKRVCRAKAGSVTEASKEEAQGLLQGV
jgi:TPR repeat protein